MEIHKRLIIKDWVTSINNENALIIVEGKKDIAALNAIGITLPVVELRNALPLFAEAISKHAKKVIILTDFDKKGKELYGKLVKEFSRLGVYIDKKHREFLQRNTKLSHIEGIDSYSRV